MILVSYPGNECLLFVSVRGEALIYGHPAGCNFIAASHCLVAGTALVFFIILISCRRTSSPAAASVKNPSMSNGSVRSLRGSLGTVASSFGPAAKPTITLIVFSTIMLTLVLMTAVVILSGYLVTCGELQYETRRQLYGSLTLGTTVSSVNHWCWSLFRDTDYHTRFHFDHYELSGQWHGQYTAYSHGRPKTWTGSHEHLLDIATGLELCLGCSWLGTVGWSAVTVLLVLHRNRVKTRTRRDEAESLEDARIWATDMAGAGAGSGAGHYEKIGMRQYETIGSMNQQPPGPPSDASDVDTLLAHQNVVAATHPDGSFFMTNEGQYVQLVNGVLTHVAVQPSPPASITYSQPQFQTPQPVLNGVLNAAYPSSNYSGLPVRQQQIIPQQMMPQQQQMMPPQQQMMPPQQQQMMLPQQQMMPPQQQMMPPQQQVSRPLMASSPVL